MVLVPLQISLDGQPLVELQYIKLAAASMGSKKIVAAVEAEISKRL